MLQLRTMVVNATEGYTFDDYTAPYPDDMTTGELFRLLRAEFGRCSGHVYIDSSSGPTAIGWVFLKRDRYENTGESYLREVWVSVEDVEPAVRTAVALDSL